MATRTIKFVAMAIKWFDKVNGNTYHSVRITRCANGEAIYCPFQYGYGDQYKETALAAMLTAKWLPAKYGKKNQWGGNNANSYERENNYPIMWNCSHEIKRDCVANGIA